MNAKLTDMKICSSHAKIAAAPKVSAKGDREMSRIQTGETGNLGRSAKRFAPAFAVGA
jgi:hypothetical protein